MATPRVRRTVLIVTAVSFAGVLIPTCVSYRRALDRAHARLANASRIAETRCGPIEYAVAGEGAPVLVVHGAGGGFDQGLDLGSALARGGFRVIAPSRFGYLRTPLPADASATAQAGAHACLLDALGVGRAAVMGVSAGGPSALQFALRFPDRTAALVLLVPAAYAPRANDAAPERMSRSTAFLLDTALRSDFLFWAASKLAPQAFTEIILGTPAELLAGAGAEEKARVQVILDGVLPVSPRRLGLSNDGVVVSSLPRYALETITTPTLAISTADDLYRTFEGARYTAEHVPGGRFIGYPTGGHMLVGHDADAGSEIVGFVKGSARF
jgi:pimeloyl-ACP methyl ester carboxylesterase